MKDALSRDHDYNLWVLLHQARDAIFKAREKELKKYGVTTMQSAVMFIINYNGGKATIGKISKWLFREPHTVSVLVNRMEKEGLVSKDVELGGKGRKNITLTEKGQQAFSDSLKRESIRKVMSCLSEEERHQLHSCLVKLRNQGVKDLSSVIDLPFP